MPGLHNGNDPCTRNLTIGPVGRFASWLQQGPRQPTLNSPKRLLGFLGMNIELYCCGRRKGAALVG